MPDQSTAPVSGTTTCPSGAAVTTVRYHRDAGGQGFNASRGLWHGPVSCDTLPALRDLMVHLLQGAYVSRCYFEWTESYTTQDPVAYEEFIPVNPKGAA